MGNRRAREKKSSSFSNLDFFFGHKPQLNFKGKERHGTSCGALVSLAMVLIVFTFVLIEGKHLFFNYFGIDIYPRLNTTPISTVTTFDRQLLQKGFELSGSDFKIAVGLKQLSNYDKTFSQEVNSQAIIDPRFGSFVTELIEYKTDSYHGTL